MNILYEQRPQLQFHLPTNGHALSSRNFKKGFSSSLLYIEFHDCIFYKKNSNHL